MRAESFRVMQQPQTHAFMQTGPPPSASAAEQLRWWIDQSSRLSDSLIESQLRAAGAEAEVARLAPIEAQWSLLSSEVRSLSDTRADALVENARVAEWNEQLRMLNAQQEKELQLMRRSLAEKDSSLAQLQSQLSSAQTAHSAAASSQQLQAAYQAKLAETQSALASAQQKLAESSGLQFQFQVLHAKYAALKKLQKDSSDSAALVASLQAQNASYRAQMEQVISSMDQIRADMLAREHERSDLLQELATLREQNIEYKNHVTRATAKIASLQHGLLMARTRLYQLVGALRKQQDSTRRECAYMLQAEQDRLSQIASLVLSNVSGHEQKHRREMAQLQDILQEDHLMHNMQMEQQEKKMQQLLEVTTGAAATQAQLQRRQAAANANGDPTAGVPAASSSSAVAGTGTGAAAPLPSPIFSPTVGFDVRDWLSLQNVPAVMPPARPFTSFPSSSAAQVHPAPVATSVAASTAKPFPAAPASYSAYRPPLAYSHGATVGASPAPAAAAAVPHGQQQISSFPQQSQPHLQPLEPQQLFRAAPGPVAPVQAAAGEPSYPYPQEPFAHAAPSSSHAAAPPHMQQPSSSSSSAVPLTRSIHVQRLAEVEAALQAMAEI